MRSGCCSDNTCTSATAYARSPSHLSLHRSDRRLGASFQTVAMDFQKIFRMHDRLYVGINGLPTDVQTMCVAEGGGGNAAYTFPCSPLRIPSLHPSSRLASPARLQRPDARVPLQALQHARGARHEASDVCADALDLVV